MSEEKLPRNIQWELARIKRYKPVVPKSVRYATDKAGNGCIYFNIQTDRLLNSQPKSDILDFEPVIFLYQNPDLIGRSAPKVQSDRPNFPRDLLHLDPTKDDQPASLCLARAGLQTVYDAQGIFGVLLRLSDWLADAKAETLYEDGWDPVPQLDIENCVLGIVDAKAIQTHAAAHPKGGYAYMQADLAHLSNGRIFLNLGTHIIDTANNGERMSAKDAMRSLIDDPGIPFHTSVPAVICWPSADLIENIPRFNRWRDITSLKAGLNTTTLWKHADEATLKLDILFSDSPDGQSPPDADMHGKRGFVLIVGLWRPAPLDPTIMGLSEDANARRLELRAYYLERSKEISDRWSSETQLRDFYTLTPATSELLEAVSGEFRLPSTAILGAGALGSAFFDYAVRGGTNKLTVIDDDLFLPHNLARHQGEFSDLLLNKVDVADRIISRRMNNVAVTPIKTNLLSMPTDEFEKAVRDVSIIFDATANPQIRSLLSNRRNIKCPVIRTELFHQGRLGVSLITQTDHPQSLNCLFRQMIALAYYDQSIRAWLAYEDTRSFLDDELILGFSCRSLTTKLPAYKVEAHASAAYAVAKAHLSAKSSPLIALNELSTEGVSLGTRIITPDPVQVFQEEEGLANWKVLVTQTALATMHSQREEKAPNETGGYLFGSIDESAREICIIAASPEPAGTQATPTHIKLGPWNTTGFEKSFLRRTYRRLPPIGTWHSHPTGRPDASKTDWETVEGFKQQDAMRGLPTIMAITGAANDRVYVAEP